MTYNFLDAVFENYSMHLDSVIGYEDYLIQEEILMNDAERIDV